jgi:hypothetical protein
MMNRRLSPGVRQTRKEVGNSDIDCETIYWFAAERVTTQEADYREGRTRK